MAATTSSKPELSLDEKCRETIDRTFPFFVIHNNHVTIQPNTSLYAICSQVYTSALSVFAIPNSSAVLATETSLQKLLASIFDADHRAFVLGAPGDADRILAVVLDEDAKACILAQAIAGIVFVLRRLAEHFSPSSSSSLPGRELTTQAFERQLRLFFGSEQRRTILDRVERSHLWGNCFAKPEILNLIMEAIDVDMAHDDSGRSSPVLKLEDDVVDPVAWVNEQRPARNLGIPDGLTIMALN